MQTPSGARSRHVRGPRPACWLGRRPPHPHTFAFSAAHPARLRRVCLRLRAVAITWRPGRLRRRHVGNTSGVTTLVFSVPAGDVVTVGSITALTEGSPNKDFAVSGQTCVGTIAGPSTCNISITFAPAVLGLRIGELDVKDGSGNVTNHVPLRGTGLGPQMIVSPATAVAITSLTGITPTAINPSSTVYDGAGNLYIDDAINGRILESTTSGTATLLGTIPASTTAAPFSSIVLSGDGTLYISSPNTGTIYKIPPGGSPIAITTPGVTLLQPAGLALDGFGYLYVADAGANQIVRIDTENGNAAAALTLTGLATALSSPQGLSVDAADNLYVADANNNRIVKIDLHTTVGLTNPATVLPISGLTLSSPEAVVVNAAGGLTIADTGNKPSRRAPAQRLALRHHTARRHPARHLPAHHARRRHPASHRRSPRLRHRRRPRAGHAHHIVAHLPHTNPRRHHRHRRR